MTNQQSELLAPPARYHDLEQPEKIPEELAIDSDLFPRSLLGIVQAVGTGSFPHLHLVPGGGFLFGDGIMDALG